MKIIETAHPELKMLLPALCGDHRGNFMETYSQKAFEQAGISTNFVQDNQSFTAQKGTLRGLHFQNNPLAQTKLVRVIRGAVYDIAVDVRVGSPHYLQWIKVELSAENRLQLLIPRGFAHGFLTLTDDVEFIYKVDQFYSPEHDRSIRFDDPQIAVEWGITDPILSEKDLRAPLLIDSDCNFCYHTV